MEEITIYKFQLQNIIDALRITSNLHHCSEGKTSYDRQVRQAYEQAKNAMNVSKDIQVPYTKLKPNNMNDIERINKQTELIRKILEGFLQVMDIESVRAESHKSICELREMINQSIEPTQPEGYHGLNKWYKTNGGGFFYAQNQGEETGTVNGYGLMDNINWDKNWCKAITGIVRLATESEMKKAILKGCEQKGIVEGARVRWMSGGVYGEVMEIKSKECHYSEASNKLYSINNTDGKGGFLDVICVFDNGEFAEVVKEEKELRTDYGNTEKMLEALKEMGKQPLQIVNSTDSSDKELLKECYEYLKYHAANYGRNPAMTNLLTKLNKHLNHD